MNRMLGPKDALQIQSDTHTRTHTDTHTNIDLSIHRHTYITLTEENQRQIDVIVTIFCRGVRRFVWAKLQLWLHMCANVGI